MNDTLSPSSAGTRPRYPVYKQTFFSRLLRFFRRLMGRDTPDQALAKRIKAIQQLPLHDWSTAFLEQKRSQADPVADAVIAQIISQNEVSLVDELFQIMVRNDDVVPDRMPAEARQYFETTAHLPAWADPALIALGEEVFSQYGMLITLLLSCKSMPECYLGAKGAEVLHRTARLNDQQGKMHAFARRITETAQFVVNVMAPGGLAPGGKGIRTAQKVRLIHAAIRYYSHRHGWDKTQFDEPINQEDLAGTLMSFSALVVEGLTTLGIHLTPQEHEAFIHCWRVVGTFMGVDADLLPNNAADALALGTAIVEHQMAPSQAGQELTAALVHYMEVVSWESRMTGMGHGMLRFLVGDNRADVLGVLPAHPQEVEQLRDHLTRLGHTLEEAEHRSVLFSRLAAHLSRAMMQTMLNLMNPEKGVTFAVPLSLQQDWGIAPTD